VPTFDPLANAMSDALANAVVPQPSQPQPAMQGSFAAPPQAGLGQPQPQPPRAAPPRPANKPKSAGATAGSASTIGAATSPLIGGPAPQQVPSSGLSVEEEMRRAVAGRGGMNVAAPPIGGF